jgi:hypothetical protein
MNDFPPSPCTIRSRKFIKNKTKQKQKQMTGIAFHRTEGDDRGNAATIWESVVFEGVAYAVGFYLAFDVLSPIVTFITEAVITVKDEAVVSNNDDDSSGGVGGGSNHKQDTTTTYGVINVEENSD